MENYICHLIQAEHGEGFQEYVYENGDRVPEGENVGVEITIGDNEPEFYLLEGIHFSPEAWNDMK